LTPHSAIVHFETLGCKLNFAESSSISRSVEESGFQIARNGQSADYYIINTCSVTENADDKCKKLIRDFKKINPNSRILIIGCYAQLKPEEIQKIQDVDLVLGAGDKFRLVEFLKSFESDHILRPQHYTIREVHEFYPSYSLGERTRSFLKVQDGCDYTCTFCTIPLARGISRNGSIQKIVENARLLGTKGIKEIVLTGVNIGDFGKSTQESFLGLIQELDKIETIARFRISSIEPNLLSSEIIQFVSGSQRFMPHFHIPLQSGSNTILGLMRRRYRKEAYRDKIQEIQGSFFNPGIGVDVIVGFPGETEQEFMETFHFLESLDISYLHVFSYSERENTLAKGMTGKLSPQIKSKRSKILHELSTRKSLGFIEKNLGNIYPVLFERAPRDGKMQGFTPNYISLETAYNPEWINQIIPFQVNKNNSLLQSLANPLKTPFATHVSNPK
jgi:threonylcarbamoyladenosine tRNA methylthiotransferase MtaB